MNRRLLSGIPQVKREGTISRQTIIHGLVHIGKGTTIGPNTVITGPVVIGNDCTLGPNCCIMPNTSIGSRVNVNPFTFLGDAIIMDDTTIGSHSCVVDTVIGERCTLADHTSVSTAAGLMDIEGSSTRSEFGAILGDNVANGPFTVYKKCIVGNNVMIEGQETISSRSVPDGSLVI
jgi:glucose-1-phosphate thymidylyltransferase